MKRILESGQFSNYRDGVRLDSASMEVANLYKSYFGKTTVFISHKHDDLEDLSGLIGFLEKNYNVKAYIDSKDSSMPSVTSGVTASKIKERIRQCDKFILQRMEQWNQNGAIGNLDMEILRSLAVKISPYYH